VIDRIIGFGPYLQEGKSDGQESIYGGAVYSDAPRSGSRTSQRQDDRGGVSQAGDCGQDVLSLAQGVRRVEAGPGQAIEGTGEGERLAEEVVWIPRRNHTDSAVLVETF
jgi:hypothetical protein